MVDRRWTVQTCIDHRLSTIDLLSLLTLCGLPSLQHRDHVLQVAPDLAHHLRARSSRRLAPQFAAAAIEGEEVTEHDIIEPRLIVRSSTVAPRS